MRHLNQTNNTTTITTTTNVSSNNSNIDIKLDMNDLKVEMPYLTLLTDCDNLIKSEFTSDDDDNDEELDFEFNTESETFETCKRTNEARKNKRKTLIPQRAIKNDTNIRSNDNNLIELTDVIENNSNCPDDNLFSQLYLENDDLMFSDSDLQENEDLLRDIDEKNIFKGIQEEADGEKLDAEMIDNVKEEWRAHWGVKCNMCEKVFPFKAEFDVHYKMSYNMVPVYTCSFCNKTAEKYSTFRSHCYRHITEGRYKCKECPKGFSLQSMLQVHMIAKHSKAKPFSCDECNKCFVTKSGLKIHVKKHKTNVKEDYPCVVCGKILHTRGGLTSHMNVHRLGRRFMCDVCGKTFTQKVNMQQHARQHTGDKPYSCDKCGKHFAEKSHLARHYSFHSEQRPFKCDVCQKMYKTERCLKVHSMVHAAERPFVCKYCNKGFLSSTKLKQHYNVHTGERPYACKYCERRFTNYPNWLKHTRRRHKVDHRTGQELVPKDNNIKTPKIETQSSVSLPSDIQSSSNNTEQILPSDFTISKSEDMILDDGLLNFPLNDDKFMLQQEIFNTNNPIGTSNALLIPYFQNHLTGQSTTNFLNQNIQQTVPMHYNDFISTQLIQQTLPCD